MTVGVLRELLRNLRAFRALYESDGVDTLQGPDGEWYSLWDLEAVLAHMGDLPPRQREAIELCLVDNIREVDAAVQMGVSPTNPVAMYATSGLEKLVELINEGGIYSTPENPYTTPSQDPVKMRRRTSGRVFCRGCGDEYVYADETEFVEVCRKMKAHACNQEIAV